MNIPNPNQKARDLMIMTVRADTFATTVCIWLDAKVMNLYGVTTVLAETMTILLNGNTNDKVERLPTHVKQ